MDIHDKTLAHVTGLSEAVTLIDIDAIDQTATFLQKFKAKGTVWLIGNGGSAATASHFAVDLRKACNIRAICMMDLTPMVTAYANDSGWVNSLSHPLHLLMRPEDCLVAISCSGKSQNVIDAAVMVGKDRLIVLTGLPGRENRLSYVQASHVVYAHHSDIRIQEDLHLIICHAITAALSELS